MQNTRGRNRHIPIRSSLALTFAILPALVLAADIVGTAGPDVLEGTPEADRIDGLGGADVMMGLAGDDTFVVDDVEDQALEAVGDGTDTVRSSVDFTLPTDVENLTLIGDGDIDGTGNGQNNRLTGNGADNVLDGMGGADRMFGQGGDDIYVVNAPGDLVTEPANGGTDTVRSTAGHTLGANVENLTLIGARVVNGTGNELANLIRGNRSANTLEGLAGNDTISGGAGNDRLIGGAGNDRLTGGPGLDEFQFDQPADSATNTDRLVDFSTADDTMRLIGAAFPALTTAGVLPAAAFGTGVSATTAAARIIYDPASGTLRYDEDGSGPAAAVRFAILLNAAAVTNADFQVVDPVAGTPVDYMSQIQPIFNNPCIQCHIGATAPHGLRLDAANSYAKIVNVNSSEVPSLKRIKPGDPDNSYLVQKIEGTAAVGGRMPLGLPPLTEEQIELIRRWVSEGANP